MKRRRATLHRLEPVAVPGVVAMCEDLLAMAKSGELRALAFAGEKMGAKESSGWATEDGRGRGFATLYLAAVRLVRRMELPGLEKLEDMHGLNG